LTGYNNEKKKEKTRMRDNSILTEDQSRHLAHIYAALRNCIHDELEFERPGFAPLDDEAFEEMSNMIYAELTELMFAANAEEAAAINAKGAEAAERREEEWLAATWRLDVGDEIADWLNGLGQDASDDAL